MGTNVFNSIIFAADIEYSNIHIINFGLAAIATEGYKKLTEQISLVIQQNPNDPIAQLIETAWVYVEFAMQEPDYFKVSFSGVVEQEQDYPEYVEQSKRGFALVMEIVKTCQHANMLKPTDTELLAISIWASIHGLIQLHLGNQLPSAVLTKFSLRQMLVFHLQQFLLIPLDAHYNPD